MDVDNDSHSRGEDSVSRDGDQELGMESSPLDICEVSWCAYFVSENKVKESETILIEPE